MYNTNYYKTIKKWFFKLSVLPSTIFLGQQVYYQDFYGLLEKVSKNKRIEMPVAEEMQLGISIGLALEGFLPVSIYQRMDFLPRAADQLINHLDLIKDLSNNLYNPKVIIITTVGSKYPLDTGLQHSKDLTEWLKVGLKNVKVFNPKTAKEVNEAFKKVLDYESSSILIFYQDLWKEIKK